MLVRAPPLEEEEEAAAPPEAAAELLPLAAAENGLVSDGSAGLDWTVIILKYNKLVIRCIEIIYDLTYNKKVQTKHKIIVRKTEK